jgi:hypothetical protein
MQLLKHSLVGRPCSLTLLLLLSWLPAQPSKLRRASAWHCQAPQTVGPHGRGAGLRLLVAAIGLVLLLPWLRHCWCCRCRLQQRQAGPQGVALLHTHMLWHCSEQTVASA